MTLIVFGVGLLVFFLTVYGTVMAGGLRLTKEQLETSPELAPVLTAASDDPADKVSARDVISSDF